MPRPAKFERVAAVIEADILSGRVANGGTLASEHDLVRRFAVSRNTIRKGLGLLADKGLIAARVGSGTFVTYNGELIDDAAGWSVSLSSGAGRLQSRILDLSRGTMEFDCTGFPKGSDCLRIDRIRFLVETGKGVSLERSRLPWRKGFTRILDMGLTDGSITKTLADYNLQSVGGRELAGVEKSLHPKDAALLSRAEGEPMLRLKRISRAADESIVEYVESLLDPDLFGLSFDF